MKAIFKVVGIGLLAIGFASCEKENNSNLDAFDDVVNTELEQRDYEVEDEMGSQECTSIDYSKHLADGVIVIDTMESFPITIVLDYGTGITDERGKVKSGKVLISLTGKMKETGSVKTISFEGFKIGEASITGSRTITNMGENSDGNIVMAITGEITASKDGKSRSKSFTRSREWLEGFETCERTDDVFLVTGSSTVSAGPRTMSTVITTPLHIAPGTCEFPISGVINIERGNGKGGVLDFGNGTCDSEASLTLTNGDVKEVDLTERKCRR